NSLRDEGSIAFDYLDYKTIKQRKSLQSRGDSGKGIYLTPNFVTTDLQAKNTWQGVISLIKKLEKETKLSKTHKLTKSLVPVSNKFNAGKLSPSYPKSTFLEACLCAITT